MGGNIGTAILSLEPPADGRIHVIEMSSFQIDLAPSLDADVGVLLNLSPDHLDRHGTMEHYAAIKERLVAARTSRWSASTTLEPRRRRSAAPPPADRCGDHGEQPHATRRLRRPGGQTRPSSRMATANAVANLAGIGRCAARTTPRTPPRPSPPRWRSACRTRRIRSGFKSFPGLPHRMEEIGRLRRVVFINDSKATNADSTEKALTSFDRILWKQYVVLLTG